MQKYITNNRRFFMTAFFLLLAALGRGASAQVPQYMSVKVNINRHVVAKSRLMAKDYFHQFAHYTGLRLVAVEVVAKAEPAPAAAKLSVNNDSIGQALMLAQDLRSYRVVLTKGIIVGFGAENLALNIQGNAYVKELNLILSP